MKKIARQRKSASPARRAGSRGGGVRRPNGGRGLRVPRYPAELTEARPVGVADDVLQQSELKYRTIFQCANDPIIVFDADTEFILEANTKACEVYGFRREEIVGLNMQNLTRDAKRVKDQIRRVFREGAIRDFEAVHLRKDGSLLHVVVNASAIPYEGRRAVLSINHPLSERQQVQEDLRRSQELLFDSSKDAVFVVDGHLQILIANPSSESLTGFSADQLVGMDIDTLYQNPQRELLAHDYRRILEGEEVVWETSLRKKNGSVLETEVHGRAIELSGVRYIQLLVRDITSRKRAESALRANEELMRRLVESTDDMIALQDLDGRYRYFNAPSRHPLSGRPVVGKTPYDLYPASVAERVIDDLRSVVDTGRSVSRESQTILGGDAICFLDQVSPVRDEEGRITGIVTVSRNITQRKFANDLLVRSDERYRAFIEQSADGIWRVELEHPIAVRAPEDDIVRAIFAEGRIGESNNALARMYGFNAAKDIFGAPIDVLLPGSDPQSERLLRDFVASGFRLTDIDLRHVDADGNVRYFQSTLMGSVESGVLIRIWGIQRDVTRRSVAEREMRLLAQTITSTRDCIVITDLNDSILFVNAALLTTYGYDEDELIGRSFLTLLPQDPAGEIGRQLYEATLAHGSGYGEVSSIRKDGPTFPVELWTSLVRNDEGEPVAIVGIARDITERRRAEEQIRASLREKEVLLKEVHHRVKNNLQIVSSLLSLQSEYIKDPEMLKVFSESQARVRSMALIHEKLYRSANVAEIDFGEYLRELAVYLFRSYGARKKGIELSADVRPVAMGIDRAIPCGLIVNELITNSLKYAFPSGKTGKVFLRLQVPAPHTVQLIVGDTGVGIPEGFDVTKSDSLGLKLVTMLTKQLEGTLALESNGDGRESTRGAQFTITFRA